MTEPELCLDWKEQGGNAKTPAPHICILLLTYKRTEMAVRAINAMATLFDYPKELLSVYVADDGSPIEHMNTVFGAIDKARFKLIGYHNQKFQGDTPFCGIGWNKALERAYAVTDYVLFLEEDWVLKKEFDPRPCLWPLVQEPRVGMIRMGTLTTDNLLQVRAYRGVHFLEYQRPGPFCYSGNPHIRHRRLNDFYGWFAPDRTPGDVEISFDNAFNTHPGGPEIWRQADIPAWGLFDHIGQERTW